MRPSPDRVRETLFNWLQPVIAGAACLDLFAGSGALGLEALSRGAAEVHFVDRSIAVTDAIKTHLAVLRETSHARVWTGDALAFLNQRPVAFDVVFLDPPYAAGLLPPMLQALDQPGWLAPGARIYLEAAASDGPPSLPGGWELLRERRAGQVGYWLAMRP